MPVSGRLMRSGSQGLRDSGVLLLLLLALAPLWWWIPRLTLGFLGSWFALFQTPLPRRWLRRLSGEDRLANAADAAGCVAVLAGGFQQDGALSPRSLRRLRHGIAVADARGLPLRLCGGAQHGGTSEAAALVQAAQSLGFRGPLLPEARSRTTLENLLALRDVPGDPKDPLLPAVLVTCPQHAPRLRRLCRGLFAGSARPLPTVVAYPVAWLPGGVRGQAALASECLYECAVHAYLTLRQLLVVAGVAAPLSRIERQHLRSPPPPVV